MGNLINNPLEGYINKDTQELTPSGKRFVGRSIAFSGLTGLATGIIDAYSNSLTAKSQAKIAEANAAAEELAYRRDMELLNEKAAREGWADYEDMKDFAERQKLLSSLSGSSGSGEERIVADTYEKYRKEHETALRGLNIQSFERWRGKEAARLQYGLEADMYRIEGSSPLLKGVLQGSIYGAENVKATTQFFSDYYKWARDNNVKSDENYTTSVPKSNKKSKTFIFPWTQKNKSYI